MSGIYRGNIECMINKTGLNRYYGSQYAFVTLYNFFTTHPNYSLIALQYGTTGAITNMAYNSSGTGTGYVDSPKGFGPNCFFVVRANATTLRPFDVYYLFQWTQANNNPLGNSPGNPAVWQTTGNFGLLCVQAAIGVGGTGGSSGSPNNGSPWKGTTAANGTDTKAAVVWGPPAGGGTGAMVFPRINNTVGANQSLRQYMAYMIADSNDSGQMRWGIVGDDDSWAFILDQTDTGAYTMDYCGIYTARNSLSVTYPFCMIVTGQNVLPWSVADQSTYGSTAAVENEGGVVHPLTASVFPLQLDRMSNFLSDINYNPDNCFSTTTYNEFDIPVGIFENSINSTTGVFTQWSGFLGQIDFVRDCYNIETNTVKSDFSRIFLGSTTRAAPKYSVPWDAQFQTAPRSGDSRYGIIFSSSLG